MNDWQWLNVLCASWAKCWAKCIPCRASASFSELRTDHSGWSVAFYQHVSLPLPSSSEGVRATLACPPAIPGMSFPFSGPFWTANIPSNHGQIKEIRPESGYLRDIPFGLQTWQWTLRELQVFVAGKIIEPNWWMGIFQKAMIIDYRRVDGSESPWLNQLNPIKSHENPCNISYQLTNDKSSAAYWPGGLRPYSSHAAGL